MNDNPRRRLHRAVTACGAALAGCVAIALFACAQVAPLKLTGEPVIGQQVLGLLAELQQPVSRHWACRGCGEIIDGPFEQCWNCGADMP